MTTMTGKYLGNLRVESIHEASGAKLITDAPVDNHGKGEAFSPTDLCATALGTCILTTMGIYAQNHDVDITGTTMHVTKTMSPTPPRRIALIEVIITMPDRPYSDKEKISLERVAASCPVHLSLHPETKEKLTFNWPQ